MCLIVVLLLCVLCASLLIKSAIWGVMRCVGGSGKILSKKSLLRLFGSILIGLKVQNCFSLQVCGKDFSNGLLKE